MSSSAPTVPAETANHVLWHFGRGGYQPGSFTQRLMEAVAAADPTNQARLAIAYPELLAAFDLAQNVKGGIERLQTIAGGGTIRCNRCQSDDGPFTDNGLCEGCARPMPLDGVA